jgi:hypothetical protein
MNHLPPDRSHAPRTGRFGDYARRLLCLCLATLFAGCLAEGTFWLLEKNAQRKTFQEGPGGRLIPDSRWGWKVSPGPYRVATPEFDVRGEVNALYMNSPAFNPQADAKCVRILALGDSHTFAAGADRDANWVSQLERKLNAGQSAPRYRAYNTAVPAYNVHQYLLRLLDQGPIVKPQYVVVGFSYATDLYDLLPPGKGGSFGLAEVDYFDLADDGRLVEKHWGGGPVMARSMPNYADEVRGVLGHFATFRFLRRSPLALWIGSHVRIGGQSLWPNMDVAVEREISPEHVYQWRLLEALLLRIQAECRRQHATLIVVGIPYLAQVYDEIWRVTFGGKPQYDRMAAITRLAAWCQAHQIAYVDTCAPMRGAVKQLGRWLHHHRDAHPTAEGHAVIAETVFAAGLIHPSATSEQEQRP